MKTLSHFLLPGLLLAAGCHQKTADPAPTKASMLTAHAWKDTSQSLVINGYEGTRTVSNSYGYAFTADGKLVGSQPGKADEQLGTWQLASSETQLVLTPTGSSTAITYQLFDLTATKVSFGFNYDEATIKQQVAAGGAQPVPTLLLAAGQFTFPATMPTFQPSQVTSLQTRNNLGPK